MVWMCRCLRFWKRSLSGGTAVAGQRHGRRHFRADGPDSAETVEAPPSDKQYIDNVFDVPAAKVLRLDREAFGETVRKMIKTAATLQGKLRLVSERTWEDSEGFCSKEELEMHFDECSKKLEDPQKCRTNWGSVSEGLALLEEEKEVHSAAPAWLIKERQNVTDAKVWRTASAWAPSVELRRTV